MASLLEHKEVENSPEAVWQLANQIKNNIKRHTTDVCLCNIFRTYIVDIVHKNQMFPLSQEIQRFVHHYPLHPCFQGAVRSRREVIDVAEYLQKTFLQNILHIFLIRKITRAYCGQSTTIFSVNTMIFFISQFNVVKDGTSSSCTKFFILFAIITHEPAQSCMRTSTNFSPLDLFGLFPHILDSLTVENAKITLP